MAIGSEMVRTDVIDVVDFWDLARTHRAVRVPKTFFNLQDSFSGTASEGEMLERILKAAQ